MTQPGQTIPNPATANLTATAPNVALHPEIHERIEARYARLDSERLENRGDVVQLMDDVNATYAIIESPVEGSKAEAEQLKQFVADVFSNNQFMPLDPGNSSRAAMSAINEEAGRLGKPFTITLAKKYTDSDGNVRSQVVSTGGSQAYHFIDEPGANQPQVAPITPLGEPATPLDGTPEALSKVVYREGPMEDDDRVVLVSRAVEDNPDGGLNQRIFGLAYIEQTAEGTAQSIIGHKQTVHDKVAIAIEVQPDPATLAASPVKVRLRDRIRNLMPGHRNRQAQAVQVGQGALGAAGVKQPGRIRRAGSTVWNGGRNAYYGAGGAMSAGQGRIANWKERRDARWYDRQRAHKRYENTTLTQDQVDADIERRRDRRFVVLGVAALAGVIGYRLSFDLGDGRDKGIDYMPLGSGDAHQGDGSSYDLNAGNRSSTWNDDPTIAHWDKSGASDWLPSWIDGDPMDPWHDSLTDNTLTWDPGDTGRPDPRIHVASQTPAPREPYLGDVPGPLRNGNPSGAWVPRTMNVEYGSGDIRELQERGRELFGADFDKCSNIADRVFVRLHEHYGDHLIELPKYSVDEYAMPGGPGLTGPDPNAHWATQAIEQDADRLLREFYAAA